MKALFDLEPTEVESDYERAFQAVGRQKRALVVLFTDLVDEGHRPLARRVPPPCSLRRHAVLVASVEDPELTAAVATPPDDARAAMRASVALELLASRRRTISLLQGLGAVVVEAPPEHARAGLRERLPPPQAARPSLKAVRRAPISVAGSSCGA